MVRIFNRISFTLYLSVGILAVLLFAVPSYSAPPKLGFVDMQKAVSDTQEFKKELARFQLQVKKEQGLIEARQKKFEGMVKEFQKQSFVLSPELKQKKEKALTDERKELERYVQDRREDFARKEKIITDKILKKMLEVLKKIGKQKKFTMILEKRAVFYSDTSSDLTGLATKTYDRIHK